MCNCAVTAELVRLALLTDLSWTDKMALGHSLTETLNAPIKEQRIMIDLLELYLDKQAIDFRTGRAY